MNSIEMLKEDLDRLKTEPSTNQNALLIHGVAEAEDGASDLYTTVTDLINSKMDIEINKFNINIIYRMGAKNGTTTKKPRSIVVSFCQRWLRDQIIIVRNV